MYAPQQDLVSIQVDFLSSALPEAEVATRTRMPVYFKMGRMLRFALQQPPLDPSKEPMVLRMEGFEIPALPDCTKVRREIKEALGEDFNPVNAFKWWKANRHTHAPVQTSKFHRVVQSLLDLKACQMLGETLSASLFCSMLSTSDLDMEAFEFHIDRRIRKGGVSVTARVRPPKTQEDADAFAANRAGVLEGMTGRRELSDRTLASGSAVAAMLFGPEMNQPGGNARIIAKLFSPARWWGPGESGWQIYDTMWLCTDKKDRLGRTVEEQGRLLWKLAGSEGDGQRHGSKGGLEIDALKPNPMSSEAVPWLPIIAIILSVLSLMVHLLR